MTMPGVDVDGLDAANNQIHTETGWKEEGAGGGGLDEKSDRTQGHAPIAGVNEAPRTLPSIAHAAAS